MNARVVLSMVLCACAGGGGDLDAAVDAGTDAGADAGMDGGAGGGCRPIPFINDLAEPLIGSREVLAGQAVVVTVHQAFGTIPPTSCLTYSATGAGTSAPVSVERIPRGGSLPEQVNFTFVPHVAGRWTFTMNNADPGFNRSGWSLLIDVVEPVPLATPCATVSRACEPAAVVGERVLCGDTMLDFSDTMVATLDGGVWFGEGTSMFVWSDGWVSPATPSGAVLRDGGVPMDRPLHWFTDDRTLVMGTDAGVFVMNVLADRLGPARRFGGDAGTPFAAAVWDAGVVVLSGVVMCTETSCRELPDFNPHLGGVYALSGSHLVYAARTNIFTGQIDVKRLDGFDAMPRYLRPDYRWVLSRAGDRRLIERSVHGLYVLDQDGQRTGMPMRFPPGFQRTGSSESHVWVVSPGQTEVYCQ